MTLGQDLGDFGGSDQFHGEVSRVNLYSRALTSGEIAIMARNCSSFPEQGDITKWVGFDDFLLNDVSKISPGICGGDDCPPGYRGSNCDILIGKMV